MKAKALKLGPQFELPLDVVTEATAIVATRGAGKSSASAVLVEEGFAAGVQTVTFDRTGVYWGLRSNTKGTGPGLGIYVLGGPHADVPLEATAGRLIADLVVDTGHSFVLDLSDFSKAQAIRFAADFLERLYDRKARSRSTTLLILDEAHFYAPQTPRGGFKGDAARLMGAMEDAVGLGRSRGLGVVLTTQRTQALNKAVLDLIETLFVMRMLSPRARDAVKGWIQEKHEDDEKGILASLDSLPTGTAWVWSPLRHILERVAIRRIKTFDSYRTPQPGETLAEPQKRTELDLTVLGEQIAATVQRAKADDPAELRKTINELRRQVAEPVPYIPDEVIDLVDRVEKAAEAFDVIAGDAQTLAAELRDRNDNGQHPPTAALARAVAAVKPPAPRRPARSEISLAEPPRPARHLDPDSDVSAPQQRILDAIAWFEAIGVPHPKRTVTAAVAGVSSKSSGFRANVSTLSGKGLVDYPASGYLALTDEGRDLAHGPAIAPSPEALHDAVYQMISRPQADILRVLVDAYPQAVTREDLAAAAGVSAASSGFRANVSTLSGFELVTYPQQGSVAAADLLFPS